MSMMDGSPAVATTPPPDAQPQTLGYHLNAALAIIGADRQILPDEQREIQAFMAGLQQIAMQKAAAAQTPGGPMEASNETSDFGDAEGAEPMDDAPEGAEYL